MHVGLNDSDPWLMAETYRSFLPLALMRNALI